MNIPGSSLLSARSSSLLRGRALTNKLIVIAAVGLLLLIPLQMVRSTLHERSQRHDAALEEVANSWGRPQRLIGPILAVPYTYPIRDDSSAPGRRARGTMYLLPETVAVDGELEPKELRRGIYAADVFVASMRVSGRFSPAEAFRDLSNVTPLWAEARIGLALSDVRRMRATPTLTWNQDNLSWEPGSAVSGLEGGLQAPVRIMPDSGPASFEISLRFNGSGGVSVAPVGKETTMALRSSWPSPRFGGAFLPTERGLGPDGFTASWHVSSFGREFPSRWTERAEESKTVLPALERAAFGVDLVSTVSAYRTIERSIKYGVLFIAMVFAIFFLFEVVCGVRLHGLNYVLVGAALCLFYLALLALAEFIGFTRAYGVATGASVAMIALYAWSILRSGGRATIVATLLGGVYGYLFFVLRMEDFALLAGTAALFVVLAAVMYFTRSLDAQPDEARPLGGPTEVTP